MERKNLIFTNDQGQQFVIIAENGAETILMRSEGPEHKAGEVVVARNLNKEAGNWSSGKYFGNQRDAVLHAYKYVYGMRGIICFLADGEDE